MRSSINGFYFPSLTECCPKAVRCYFSPPPLRTLCGSLRSGSCQIPTSSSLSEKRRPWTLSSSITCSATARRTSSTRSVTSTEPSLSHKLWSSVMCVCLPLVHIFKFVFLSCNHTVLSSFLRLGKQPTGSPASCLKRATRWRCSVGKW